MQKDIPDQYTQYTWYQGVKKREKCSAKTACNIKSRQTCKSCNLSKNTKKLVETSSEVTVSNMEMAAKEVHSINNNNSDMKSTGVSFDCTQNSRGWQAKEGIVAAITTKILDIVKKTTYCRDCQKNQKLRDDNEMKPLEYMEWFMNQLLS